MTHNTPIDRDDITRWLHELVTNGPLQPGDILPSERILARIWGTSRATIRRAIHQLRQQQLIETRHGSGHYVRHPTPRP